jgi:hypothetical protein
VFVRVVTSASFLWPMSSFASLALENNPADLS